MHGRSRESSAQILRAKVQGTLALERALRNVPIDFFLLCSSLTAILGGLGQADYAAANCFLDAYAESRHGEEGRFVISVNWDGWRELGPPHDMQRKGRKRTARHASLTRWSRRGSPRRAVGRTARVSRPTRGCSSRPR